MKIKNKDIVAFINGCAELKKKRLPVKLGFAIKKNLGTLKDAASAYNEEMDGLFSRYLEKDGEGKPLVQDNDYVLTDREAFMKERKELLDIEVEAEIHRVPFEEIEKCDDPRYDALTVEELEAMEFMTE